MSYLNKICCPDHPYTNLIEDYRAGNMVRNFLVLYLVFLFLNVVFIKYQSFFISLMI